MITSDSTPLYHDEQWKPIPNFEAYYSISNYGRIMRTGKVAGAVVGRILAQRRGHPYFIARLCKEGKFFYFTVHSLVALAFIGERPDGYQINHKDGDKFNNHVDNLEYCTASENAQHAIRTGLKRIYRGEECAAAILTEAQVREIKKLLRDTKLTLRAIGDMYSVSFKTIGNIKYNHRWSHVEIDEC